MDEIEKSKKSPSPEDEKTIRDCTDKIRFEIWGDEVIQKRVKSSARSGRVYVPPGWVGHKVKIIRID